MGNYEYSVAGGWETRARGGGQGQNRYGVAFGLFRINGLDGDFRYDVAVFSRL